MKKILENAALSAGRVVLKHFANSRHEIRYKSSHRDFLTQADLKSQETIKKEIIGQMSIIGIKESEIGFIGEENLNKAAKHHLFIIDPLDGTINFESGLDCFAISIAYCLNGKILEGLIYRPTTNEFYYAKKNHGAYKNNKRLSVSAKPIKSSLMDVVISSRTNIYPQIFKELQNIFPHVKGLRSIFCITLSGCFFSENIFNIILVRNTYIWDIAAVSLIVSEAGGIMVDFKGNPIDFKISKPDLSYQVLICHEKIKTQVLALLK